MGKHITDIEQLYKGITGMFAALDQLPDIKRKMLKTEILIGFYYDDPEGQVVVDASGDEIKVYAGECPAGIEPEVKLMMSADTAHLFWLGKVNFVMATATGKMRTEGNIGGVVKLVPVLRPLFKVYTEFLQNNGLAELVV